MEDVKLSSSRRHASGSPTEGRDLGGPAAADAPDPAVGAKAKHAPHAAQTRPTASRRIARANAWTGLSAIAACAAALFAGWAAWETHRSAIETNKSTRAVVWLQLLAEYGSPEMFGAMKALREWQQERPRDFDREFKALLLKKGRTPQESARIQEIDGARRRVGHFFLKLKVMTEEGIIDEQVIGKTWPGSTYRFVADVLTPLERAKIEAMLESGAITAADKAENEQVGADQLAFYRRALHLPSER
jgi:hypothetical protein